MRAAQGSRGFSLVELLLALAIGCGLSGVLLHALVAEGANSQRFGRLLRERAVAQRTLELVRGDLLQAGGLADPLVVRPACNLAGRTVVLHLAPAAGNPDAVPITYSLGKPAEPIWRGRVLMRCGPAYGLHGELGRGAAQNRVVIDALAPSEGFRAQPDGPTGLLQLELQQVWGDGGSLHTQLPVALALAE
nr:prepilin-type N-terminal cleavage/methylation domain-containing protein [Cyanobium sp. FACHB-13342]